jgi:hypothetical protein
MSAQDIWARKYHELWEKVEKNTKHSFCTALWKWLVILMLNLPGSCATDAQHRTLTLSAANLAKLACTLLFCLWMSFACMETAGMV